MRSFISYFLRLKGSAGRTAAALLVCSKDRKILFKIKILKMRLRLPYSLQQISGWYLGLPSAFFTSGPCSCTPSSGRDSSFLRLLRTWRAVGRGIFPLFHLTIVLASLLVHVWMAARSVTVTGTTSRPLPTSSSTCRTGGTISRIPRAGVLYWDDIDNGTLSIEFSMLLFCPPATSRAAPEIFMCHY